MWIAEFSESSNLWTQIALSGYPGSMPVWASFNNLHTICVGREFMWRSARHLSLHVSEPCGAPLRAAWKAQLASVLLMQSSRCALAQFSFDCSVENLLFWPQIRQDYPLNLSILISGGKETNKDSPSNGEWSGMSSNLKSLLLATANCSLEKHF